MLAKINLNARALELCELVRSSECTDVEGRSQVLDDGIECVSWLLRDARERHGNVYLIGNGGSAAVASHVANDFCNIAGLRAVSLLDHSSLTCFANDYGYENVYSQRLRRMAQPQDVLIAISSSGESENIVRAAQQMRECGGALVTLSGFGEANRLRALGKVNFWIDSHDYGLVELGHLFMLHHLVDCIRLSWAAINDD